MKIFRKSPTKTIKGGSIMKLSRNLKVMLVLGLVVLLLMGTVTVGVASGKSWKNMTNEKKMEFIEKSVKEALEKLVGKENVKVDKKKIELVIKGKRISVSIETFFNIKQPDAMVLPRTQKPPKFDITKGFKEITIWVNVGKPWWKGGCKIGVQSLIFHETKHVHQLYLVKKHWGFVSSHTNDIKKALLGIKMTKAGYKAFMGKIEKLYGKATPEQKKALKWYAEYILDQYYKKIPKHLDHEREIEKDANRFAGEMLVKKGLKAAKQAKRKKAADSLYFWEIAVDYFSCAANRFEWAGDRNKELESLILGAKAFERWTIKDKTIKEWLLKSKRKWGKKEIEKAFNSLRAKGWIALANEKPRITYVSFPPEILANGTEVVGRIGFEDPDGDVSLVTFEMVGREDLAPISYDPGVSGITEGVIEFVISTDEPQEVTYWVTLSDEAGNVSDPAYFTFVAVSLELEISPYGLAYELGRQLGIEQVQENLDYYSQFTLEEIEEYVYSYTFTPEEFEYHLYLFLNYPPTTDIAWELYNYLMTYPEDWANVLEAFTEGWRAGFLNEWIEQFG